MKMKSGTSSINQYLMRVKQFPLHAIRCAAEAAAANEVLLDLVLSKPELTPGERDYVEALTALIQHYELSRPDAMVPHASGLDTLRHLMKESAMRPADLARIIGHQPTASQILAGKRELSKDHIRKLADHFKLSTDVFMDRKAPKLRRAS